MVRSEVSHDLASALAQISQVLLAVQTGDTVVNLVTALAIETLPGTVGAGVTLVNAEGKHTRAASNALVEQADQLQYTYDAGPCLTAWRDQVPVQIDDISTEVRWPEWTAAVAALGVRSMLSVPMLSAGRSMGAIKVYSDRPRAYDSGSVTILELFAQQAAVLLSNTQAVSDARELSAQLTAALEDRDVIGQATGVCWLKEPVTCRLPLGALRSAAQRAGTSLHTVAHGSWIPPSPGTPIGRHDGAALTIADEAEESFPNPRFEAARIQGELECSGPVGALSRPGWPTATSSTSTPICKACWLSTRPSTTPWRGR